MTTALFCADPLNPRRVDPAFAHEVRAAEAAGLRTARIDHDALLAGDATAAVARVPRGAGPAWYRGWMVPAERYGRLAAALAERDCHLLTTPAQYRRAHELPGWYQEFAAFTPRSVWLDAEPGHPPAAEALKVLAAPLGEGPAVVKDWVKSRKHEWDEAAFVPDAADTDRLTQVVRRLFELQEEFLTGGVVLRAFERYAPHGEARVWWVDGEPVLTTAHPDTPGLIPEPAPEPREFAPAVRALDCRFVSTDLALREDGMWRVVEVGDGQVTGLPAGTDPAPLLEALGGRAR